MHIVALCFSCLRYRRVGYPRDAVFMHTVSSTLHHIRDAPPERLVRSTAQLKSFTVSLTCPLKAE